MHRDPYCQSEKRPVNEQRNAQSAGGALLRVLEKKSSLDWGIDAEVAHEIWGLIRILRPIHKGRKVQNQSQ
jgi:hypothetical protein